MAGTESTLLPELAFLGISVYLLSGLLLLYFWLRARSETYFLYWGAMAGLLALALLAALPGPASPLMARTSLALDILAEAFLVVGALNLLAPQRKSMAMRHWLISLATVAIAVIGAGIYLGAPITSYFVIACASSLLAGCCLWLAYRAGRLMGYAVTAAAMGLQTCAMLVAWLIDGLEWSRFATHPVSVLILAGGAAMAVYEALWARQQVARTDLRDVYDVIPIPLVTIDPTSGKIEAANEEAAALLSTTAHELLNRTAQDLHLVPDHESQLRLRQQLATHGSVRQHEISIRKGADTAILSLNAVRVDLGQGPRDVIALFDLTALRTAQAALKKLAEDLEQQVAVRTRDLDAFTYTVSHDLRAPLRAIDGFAHALADELGELPAPAASHLERVLSNCKRMSSMIESLLGLARHSNTALQVGPTDLSALARTAIGEITEAGGGREVSWVVAPDLQVTGDAAALGLVLQNLLGNAFKYTKPSPFPRIELSAEESAGETVYSVTDNGVGFDMQFAAKLFKPFQRLHPASEFEGIGIGLATVQRIIERHGGRVWIEAQMGRGTRVFFTLGTPS